MNRRTFLSAIIYTPLIGREHIQQAFREQVSRKRRWLPIDKKRLLVHDAHIAVEFAWEQVNTI